MGNHFVKGEGGNCAFMGKEWRIISSDFQGLSENVLDITRQRRGERERMGEGVEGIVHTKIKSCHHLLTLFSQGKLQNYVWSWEMWEPMACAIGICTVFVMHTWSISESNSEYQQGNDQMMTGFFLSLLCPRLYLIVCLKLDWNAMKVSNQQQEVNVVSLQISSWKNWSISSRRKWGNDEVCCTI